MNFLLRIKHWQLFALLVLLVFGQAATIIGILTGGDRVILEIVGIMIAVLFVGIYMGWQFSVVMKLRRLLPPNVDINLTYFKVCIFIVSCISIGYLIWFITILIPAIEISTNINPIPSMIGSLLALGPTLYCFSMIAKMLKSVELQREAKRIDFDFYIFWLLCFFPIGIWVLQPKVNRMVKKIT